MFLPQTLKEYLENPMGKGSTAIINRKLIKDDLNKRYDKLISKHKDFKYTIYTINDNYFFHFLIPSESERENTYDVVIEFYPEDKAMKYDNFLYRYYMRVFSNCPSFVYTYAFVYNENNMLISSLKNKYDNIVLKDNPVIRNPGEVINYEKSIYFACRYLEKHITLMNKIVIKDRSKKNDIKNLSNIIRNTDKILLEIKKENSRLKKDKEDNKKDTEKTSKIKDPHRITKVEKFQSKGKIKPRAKMKPSKKIGKRK